MTRSTVLWVAGVTALVITGLSAYFIQSTSAPKTSSAVSASELPRYRAGGLEVGVTTIPATPRVGDNVLVVELRTPDGKPISGAAIEAFAEMPAMGAMPAMRAPADLVETAPGRYESIVNLSMRGEWPLTLRFEGTRGQPVRMQFDLATDRPNMPIAAGGTPVDAAPVGPGLAPAATADAIVIDSRRRQLIGVKTGEVNQRRLIKVIRAVGEVTVDERRLSQVVLKFDGYVGDLNADYVGSPVKEGEVLFTVYGPELLAAQQEYLEILKRRQVGDPEGPLIRAARQRLRLWDMAERDIEALERRRTPQDYVPIIAPRTGTLVERNIAAGGAAQMGQTLLTVADLSTVWVDAKVFEADLELVRIGMDATITLPYLPGRVYAATVDYVYPYLEGDSRTGRIRLSLENPEGVLKPAMYAEVALQADFGHRLAVPEEAIIVAGDSRVVFVDLGEGRLKPVTIKTGRRVQGYVEVLEGLSLGDAVVTSGNFLIAAETRLKTGIEQW